MNPGKLTYQSIRIFWIYFIITIFFTIFGLSFLINSNNPNWIAVSIVWIIANLALMLIVYHSSINWTDLDVVCNDNNDNPCINIYTWAAINVLFIVLLIIATLWATELNNQDGGILRSVSGILILLGSLLLIGIVSYCNLSKTFLNINKNITRFITPFWIAVVYILIWFGLTLYTLLYQI